MSENDINRTSLGKPSSEIRHNKECINGKQYTANLYDFYSGSDKIFTARCVQGMVKLMRVTKKGAESTIKPYLFEEAGMVFLHEDMV